MRLDVADRCADLWRDFDKGSAKGVEKLFGFSHRNRLPEHFWRVVGGRSVGGKAAVDARLLFRNARVSAAIDVPAQFVCLALGQLFLAPKPHFAMLICSRKESGT